MADTPDTVLDRLSPRQRHAVEALAVTQDVTTQEAARVITDMLAADFAAIRAPLKALFDGQAAHFQALAVAGRQLHDAGPAWWHEQTRAAVRGCPWCCAPDPVTP